MESLVSFSEHTGARALPSQGSVNSRLYLFGPGDLYPRYYSSIRMDQVNGSTFLEPGSDQKMNGGIPSQVVRIISLRA